MVEIISCSLTKNLGPAFALLFLLAGANRVYSAPLPMSWSDAPPNTNSSIAIYSEGCVRTDSTVLFPIIGSSLQGDSIIGVSLSGSQNFQLVSTPALPSLVGLVDSIVVGYTSQSASRDSGTLNISYLLNGIPFDTAIQLIGVRPGPAIVGNPLLGIQASQSLQIPSSSIVTTAGDSLNLVVALDHDLPVTSRIDSIELSYIYDDGLLTPVTITPLAGWGVNIIQAFAGVVHLRLIPSAPGLADSTIYLAGTPMAIVQFATSISRTAEGSISLSQFDYYLNPATRAGCLVQSVDSRDSVSFSFAPQCGNAELAGALRAEPVLNLLSLYPNPSGLSSQMIDVTFNLQSNAQVTVNLTDVSGNAVTTLVSDNLTSGQHTVGLNSSGIPSGTYYVVVTASGQRVIRKIVVVK